MIQKSVLWSGCQPSLPGTRVSPHEQTINDALFVLDVAGTAPRQVVLVGIVPSTLDGGIALSPAVVAEPARRAA